MQELSMNVLDVAENSVAAGATLVAITLSIDTAAKRMTLALSLIHISEPTRLLSISNAEFC